jgi:adenosylcobinamide kinase/adenosylcobinamide-phosphate guanylyltransferase
MHPTFKGLGFLLIDYMSNKLILITGGARSGKSLFARKLAGDIKGRKVFLATAQALDEEMKLRIEKHKKERPLGWDTVEEAQHLSSAIKKFNEKYEVMLIDCLSMWISNLLIWGSSSELKVLKEVDNLITNCKKIQGTVIIVSNEVGSGIVPDNKLSRLFRDIVGRANQEIASIADEVYLVAAGIPLNLKGKKCN